MHSDENFVSAVSSRMSSLFLIDPYFVSQGFRYLSEPFCGFWLKMAFGSGTHFLSKWPLMEISTTPLSLECQIWYGCISRLRARGSERVRSTPSGFLSLEMLQIFCNKLQKISNISQTSNPHNSLISQPIWAFQKAKLWDFSRTTRWWARIVIWGLRLR